MKRIKRLKYWCKQKKGRTINLNKRGDNTKDQRRKRSPLSDKNPNGDKGTENC